MPQKIAKLTLWGAVCNRTYRVRGEPKLTPMGRGRLAPMTHRAEILPKLLGFTQSLVHVSPLKKLRFSMIWTILVESVQPNLHNYHSMCDTHNG